jgi:general secretion pathway protein H
VTSLRAHTLPVPARPHAGRKAGVSPRGRRGMTLIEIAIALLIAAVLFSAVTVSIGAITGAKAKAAAGELAGVVRALYDTAGLTGKTCRLVFELPGGEDEETPVRYHAECAAGSVTTARDREAALREDTARPRDGEREERGLAGQQGGTRSLEELMTAEQQRVEQAATFQGFTSEAVEARTLPGDVRVGVWTRQQRVYVESGVAYLYFFPQGFTEKAQVRLSQGDNVWTLTVAPLTGKVTVVPEALEVPRS